MINAEESYIRFVQGDRSAFSDVLDTYRDSLIFFINNFVRNEDTAEEIAADSFAELIVHPMRFSFRSSLKTYLFQIAHNKAVNYIKRSEKLKFVPLDEAVEKSNDYMDFENHVLADERNRVLHDALFKIKDDYRTALHLIYFEEMSYKDAANVMNKSVKQIDNLVARGKASLKKVLEKEGFVYEE